MSDNPEHRGDLRPKSQQDWEKAEKLLKEGMSMRAVDRELGWYKDKTRKLKNKFTQLSAEVNPGGDWTNAWYKTKDEDGNSISIHLSNPQVKEQVDLFEKYMEKIREYRPGEFELTVKKYKDPHLLLIDPADIHIGKLALAEETGENYNTEIAIDRTLEGIRGILEKTASFDLEEIVLIIGNDILHIDTPARTTSGGTPQDTCGQWWSMFNTAVDMYIKVITALAFVAPVRVIYNPSNHDYQMGYGVARVIQAWFANYKSVMFDIEIKDEDMSIRHRKYFKYGENLIGTSHGDGAKEKDMPMLMAQEASKMWGDTTFRYLYLHHIHHKKKISYQSAKDYIGVTVEYLRSPSSPDAWHGKKGYDSYKAIEAFLHHPENGQVGRFTHYFK